MMDASAIRAFAESVRRAPSVEVSTAGLKPFALVPAGFDVKPLDELRTTLDRIEQGVTLLTAEAFVAYWTRFAKGDSVIFADETKETYVAILDYHKAAGDPAWCEHVATFTVQPSLEWKVWTGSNGRAMQQAEFARFIEDNYVDIVKPAHADMIAIAGNLQAKRSVEFAEATVLQSGETQLLYNEKIRATAETKQGSMKIPVAWRDNREKRRAQKRASNARVRARKRAALPPKVFDRCLRCKRRLRDKVARQVGYGRICAIFMLAKQNAPQLDWIGHSRADIARLRGLSRKRPEARA